METVEIEIRVGQLWRRRLDGRRFIPAHRVADGWLDLAGIKRTESDLHQKYVLMPLDTRRSAMLDESDERRTAVLRTLPTHVDEWNVVVRRSVGRDFRRSRTRPGGIAESNYRLRPGARCCAACTRRRAMPVRVRLMAPTIGPPTRTVDGDHKRPTGGDDVVGSC